VPQCEQTARGLLRSDRSPPLLHELDEPVGGIESELHADMLGEHTFVINLSVYAFV
jgi:hypothetical protein